MTVESYRQMTLVSSCALFLQLTATVTETC